MSLHVHAGGGTGYRTGEEVLAELFDLIKLSIPEMHPADPVRVRLSRLAPYLGGCLGHPPVQLLQKRERLMAWHDGEV